MEESTCPENVVIDLLKRFIVVLNVYFLHLFNCFKYDFHFDAESMIVRMLEMSRNISVYLKKNLM